ncbi:Uncharacterized protein APZ42_015134 [Daphnia magna]|uniref:Uncharacterized protein n=1 Tax=Daphnia magna TaxID=35525 RepID=A0A0P6GCR7_9CRUS|nr:Uncharacterized protein APZ42_015134 [Daphnia magna]
MYLNNNRAKSHFPFRRTETASVAVDFVISPMLFGDPEPCNRREVQELFGQVLVNPSDSCCSTPLTS